jgi:hypothetical protein
MSTVSNTVSSYNSQYNYNTQEGVQVPFTLVLFDLENNSILYLSMFGGYYTGYGEFSMILPNNIQDIVGSTIQNVEHKILERTKKYVKVEPDDLVFPTKKIRSFVVTITTTNGEYKVALNNNNTDLRRNNFKFIYGDININSKL